MTGQPWLSAVGLHKQFGPTVAISGADLTLRPGEIRGVVGPNGAGKSTLMQILAGNLTPEHGEIRIDGTPVTFRRPGDAIAAGISLVPQEMRLGPNLSVADNVVLGNEPRRLGFVSARRSRQLAETALRRLGAHLDPDAAVTSLSPVDRRLVMVARALARDARLVILDEPTAALAPHEAGAILTAVRSIAATGVSFLYVSHRFDDIEQIADTVTGVRDARVVADLPRDQIRRAALVALVSPVDELSHPVPPTARAARAAATAEPVLRVDDLRGGPLQGVSLAVGPGEIVGVAGLSGSGADELMSMVAGITVRAGGTVRVAGGALPSGDRVRAVRAGVAYVPGNRTLAVLPNHDIRTNVSISNLRSFSRWGVPTGGRETTVVRRLMDAVRLTAAPGQTISSLSGGNQQKAVFARWMARDCTVLLLHDPTAGVDVRARAEIHQRVRELAATGLGVVVVTTDVPELVELSDRVLVLDRGALVADLPGAGLTEQAVLTAMVSTPVSAR
ncbi:MULTISPECIES: sugar ABC transporter ATP-binding protein [Micromonospora]|uniref:Ribose transport system ATP-binding protein n=1 Tax=Micromonospora yangpuensis TaxID=683228 RepID=A0A1C6UVY0_9ACTN|nr:sugar ABC transporter ATP-binding protein [Micromonospora yangpuensis]GGM25794.1 sugar ABC transporter ATP-binding protein [Micromonospora yangpuensis]SCL58141.1 ribose transport system ATP-binding protein [Micromonospora yangpuensis]